MSADYLGFLRSKEIRSVSVGFEPEEDNPLLFD